MIKTDAAPFGRLITAMVTPFGDNGEVDYSAAEKLVNYLIGTGTDSIVVSGTTGESPTLTEEEKLALLKTAVSASAGRAKIIMGTGSNNTSKSIEASLEAEKLGADGVLVVAPYYNKPSQEGLFAHFEAIGKATKLPMFVYNIPGRTGINITAETLLEMSKRIPNVFALKDSTGSVEQAAELAGKAHAGFKVYSGDDYLTLPFLSIGGCGVVSVASHLAGPAIKDMMEAFFAGNLEKARELHYKYLPLFKGLFTAPNPTCVKFALAQKGLCKPHLRLPLTPLPPAQQEALMKILNSLEIGVKVPVA